MRIRLILIVGAISTGTLALSIAGIVLASVARLNLSSLHFGALVLAFLVGCVTGAAAWLLGLMQTARLRSWDWFVEVLVLGPLGALLYGLAGAGEAIEQRKDQSAPCLHKHAADW
jgi:hypothetical protein